MNFKTLLVALLVAGCGFYYWDTRRADAGGTSPSGFSPMPPLAGAAPDGIVLLAPEGCPMDGGVRADLLAQALSDRGVPFTRSNKANLTMDWSPNSAELERVNAVMQGEVPIVFVRGKAKANPTLEEVLAEYGAGR